MISKRQKQTQYKNRYGDIYTFTHKKKSVISWQGNFQYCGITYQNDYSEAFEEYKKDNGSLSLEDFKVAIHAYDDSARAYPLIKYLVMVKSIRTEPYAVDPSGGPWISIGMKMDSFGFKDYIVEKLNWTGKDYEIIVSKK
jgi:hypothetical protein